MRRCLQVKITKGKRPDAQIRKCEPPALKQLIEVRKTAGLLRCFLLIGGNR
jgi:hypothetical protein